MSEKEWITKTCLMNGSRNVNGNFGMACVRDGIMTHLRHRYDIM